MQQTIHLFISRVAISLFGVIEQRRNAECCGSVDACIRVEHVEPIDVGVHITRIRIYMGTIVLCSASLVLGELI